MEREKEREGKRGRETDTEGEGEMLFRIVKSNNTITYNIQCYCS